MKDHQSKLEYFFEHSLWQLRWSVLVAVIFSALTAIIMFYVSAVDTYYIVHMLTDYAGVVEEHARKELRAEAVAHIVEVIDGFLLAVVLLIFSYGTYELYISRITDVQQTEAAEHLLQIKNLDDLKARLGKVVLMILIVKFFGISMGTDYETVKELTIFAVSIAIIAFSFFIAETAARKNGQMKTRKADFDETRKKLSEPEA